MFYFCCLSHMKDNEMAKCILNRCWKYPKTACGLMITFVAAMVLIQSQLHMAPKYSDTNFIKTFEVLLRKQELHNGTSSQVRLSQVLGTPDGRWENFTTPHFRLFAYSAFFDDRPSLLGPPVVRITAVSDLFDEFQSEKPTRFYCILHYTSEVIPVHMNQNPKRIGVGWSLNNKIAREYIYACPTVNGTAPKSVSITTQEMDLLPIPIPVVVPNKPKIKQDFCVCVQAAYGTLDPYRIIEWLELQRILGVSLVGVYILSASESVLKVFRHYSDENFIDLRKINYIYSNETGAAEFWLHLTPAINDCIYRHMYEFKRIIVIDFDEFIMPRIHQNLSEMMEHLEHHSQRPHFTFSNNYFFMDLKSDETVSKYLTFLKYRSRVEVSPPGVSLKSIINPQACVHMHNHYCWGSTKNYSASYAIFPVIPQIALNQHYKKCHFMPDKCQEMMKTVIKDDKMLRFEEILTKNVRKKIREIMGHDI